MPKKIVTLIPGDGIGPEVVNSARAIIDATGVQIEWDEQEAGAEVFKRGVPSGVPQETIQSIKRTHCVLKGPLETPVGFGEKSANVTLRKLFETYANIRPVREFAGVLTPFSGRGIDLVIVRENVEDLYAGIEYMQTPGVAETLKLISKKGCEKIVRMAFELARAEGRPTVTCATKANIMKMSEGLLKRTFEEIAPEYSDIESWHIIVDNCAHQLAKRPEQFDIIVTTNMNGDILSDLASGLIGGLGFAPSANLGSDIAIFEAVHGSAPKYAGKDVINPTALILSAVMLLRYLDFFDQAQNIENALTVTLEEGKVMTRDVVGDEKAAGTKRFTEEIITNLGKTPKTVKAREYKHINVPSVDSRPDFVTVKSRKVVGVDVFVESALDSETLGKSLEDICADSAFKLELISNRGTKVYPATGARTDCIDAWQCRFVGRDGDEGLDARILELIASVGAKHAWTHIEKLQLFDGKLSYTRVQGED